MPAAAAVCPHTVNKPPNDAGGSENGAKSPAVRTLRPQIAENGERNIKTRRFSAACELDVFFSCSKLEPTPNAANYSNRRYHEEDGAADEERHGRS